MFDDHGLIQSAFSIDTFGIENPNDQYYKRDIPTSQADPALFLTSTVSPVPQSLGTGMKSIESNLIIWFGLIV